MLLHNAIHLFMNDELRGGLRDVMDFRDLYEHFLAQDAAFETQLLERAGVDVVLSKPLKIESLLATIGVNHRPALAATVRRDRSRAA